MSEEPDLVSPQPLESLRTRIDEIDDQLLTLLNQRAALAKQVAQRKQATGGAFYAPNREGEIVDRLVAANTGLFPSKAIRPVFQEIISACLSLQKRVRVAYLGPEATFTHQAVKRQFGSSAIPVPCASIAGVFDEVERGQADFAVVPVENSTEGVVTHTLDSFVDSRLCIQAEIVLDIEHVLLARPNVQESAIRRVYSHPQALAQCRRWLEANLPGATRVECGSTAAAAQRAKADPYGGAVAAELAARIYKLEVLRRQLQDAEDNVTRFLVVGVSPRPRSDEPTKTSVVLVLPDEPGALYNVLRPLSDAGINLTRIESRPSRRQAWEYVFFLDLEGYHADSHIAPVLAALEKSCKLFKILGSYPKADRAS